MLRATCTRLVTCTTIRLAAIRQASQTCRHPQLVDTEAAASVRFVVALVWQTGKHSLDPRRSERPVVDLQVRHNAANGFARRPLQQAIRIADPRPGRKVRNEYIGGRSRGLRIQTRHGLREPLRMRSREIAARPSQLRGAETGKTPEKHP